MGRGRVELKRIENKINRQVTFAKRRSGLLKKAYELSVLCDAEVALIIFSNRGKLYEFCSSSSMQKTLERYQRCSYGALDTSQPAKETGSSYQEYQKLKAKVDVLQRTQRNLLGDDLGELSTKELEQLEHQLDKSLRQIRSTKTQFMLDQLADLQQKEEILLESNTALKRRLEESCGFFRAPQDAGPPNIQYARQPEMFFEPLECNNNTFQIGFNPGSAEQMIATTSGQNINGFGAGWLL
ncbi:hypothetical protein Nepgr_003640 [Nepenthes gracilis]|uniref:Uncharacterized protein n=1 Tax=Nepenthes gracilis TaxID=150966 RepID=A0AAD3XE79_NEPGR|nr:hypothetical protein Nepgr_003640 [Nepenthes gracilis]